MYEAHLWKLPQWMVQWKVLSMLHGNDDKNTSGRWQYKGAVLGSKVAGCFRDIHDKKTHTQDWWRFNEKTSQEKQRIFEE